MALNKATKDHHIDNQYTSLVLIGGVDVSKDFISKAVDLRVEGGALIRKQLLVLGNICTNDTILGTFEGNVVTSKITAKELTEGITVIGNVCGHPDNFFKSNIITSMIDSEGGEIFINGNVTFNGNLSGVTVNDVITDVVAATEITSQTITTNTLFAETANITNLNSETITSNTLNVANIFAENIDVLCGNIGNVHTLEVNYITHKTQFPNTLGNTQANVVSFISPIAIRYPTSTPDAGERNLFLGYDAGFRSLSGAYDNTLIGYNAGREFGNVVGTIAIGSESLGNATGELDRTIAIGTGSLRNLILGRDTIAIGYNSGYLASRMFDNIAIGNESSQSAYSFKNIAIGGNALKGNTTNPYNINFYNVAIGYDSLRNIDTSGYRNVTVGHKSGLNLTSGENNVLIGSYTNVANYAQDDSVAIGSYAVALSDRDVQLGSATTGTTGNLYFRQQIVSQESWKDGQLALASIDGDGNIIKGNVDLSNVLANIMFGNVLMVDSVCANVVETAKLSAKGPSGNIEVCGNLMVEGDLVIANGTITLENGEIIGGADPSIFRADLSGPPQALATGATGIDITLVPGSNNLNVPGTWSGDTFTVDTGGWYHLNASANFGDAIDNKFSLEFLVNGTIEKCIGHSQYHASSSNALCSIDCTVYLETSDDITLRAKQYTGSPQSIIDAHFSIFKLNGVVGGNVNSIIGDLSLNCSDITDVQHIFVKDNVVIGNIENTSAVGTTQSIAIGGNAVCTEDCAIALGQDVLADQPGGFFVKHRFGPFTVRNAGFDTGNTTNELVEVTSSRRFKENIRDLEDVQQKIQNLRPVRYNGKPGFGDNREHIGLIAEELDDVFPEFVSYDPNSTTPRGIMYDHMVAILIKELQRLSKENDDIKQRLHTLENKL